MHLVLNKSAYIGTCGYIIVKRRKSELFLDNRIHRPLSSEISGISNFSYIGFYNFGKISALSLPSVRFNFLTLELSPLTFIML